MVARFQKREYVLSLDRIFLSNRKIQHTHGIDCLYLQKQRDCLMKVYHIGSKYAGGPGIQAIFVASDDSKGVDHMKEVYAQITVYKKQKVIEILVPKDWTTRTHHKQDSLSASTTE